MVGRGRGIRLVRARLVWELVVAAAVDDVDFRIIVVLSSPFLSNELRLRVMMLVRNMSSAVSLRVRGRSGVDGCTTACFFVALICSRFNLITGYLTRLLGGEWWLDESVLLVGTVRFKRSSGTRVILRGVARRFRLGECGTGSMVCFRSGDVRRLFSVGLGDRIFGNDGFGEDTALVRLSEAGDPCAESAP